MGLTDYFAGSQTPTAPTGFSDVPQSITSIQNWINGVNGVSAVNAGYVLIPPKGYKGGIAGFVFDYEGEEQITLESEITDHFAEDNSSVQDHIALRPYRVVLRGFISELVQPSIKQGFFGALSSLQANIGTVQAYLGKYTPQSLQKLQGIASNSISQVQNYATQAAGYLNQAKNLAALFGAGSAAPTRQQAAFVALATLRDQRAIFTVLTPWVFLKGMAIESLVFVQSKDSKTRTDITVTMKQMRFVDVQSAQNVTANAAGRAGTMYQTQTSNGSTPGTSVPLTSTPLGTSQGFGNIS